ncbi:MAG: 3-phosphoserine/phosphohydroxythreonine transaminase, partial [Clostridia bacterium]|nr:3-phosphoserine/phosphohydroxythreonine transaminase [Clostridia bacterium]
SKPFEKIIESTEASIRRLMKIPDNYHVLFVQGGGSTQFAAVPLNLMTTGKADYIVSGQFSGKAQKEAARYGDARIVASSKDDNFTYVPKVEKNDFRPDADYVHICFNNTIYGTTFNYIPDTGLVPLVADMSSFIISQPVDVTRFGLIYAGAQKNMGPAGMTLVIVRDDLIGHASPMTPTMLDYKVMAENKSLYNTPPCYSIYVAGLVYEWVENLGGLEAMEKINRKKAAVLYDYLDSSKLFKPTARKDCRSLMNVCFVTGNEDLDKAFCAGAAENGLVNVKGHRSVGGMRASIYNAMPIEGVEKLVEFMADFEKKNA